MTKREQILAIYEHLRNMGAIHTQKDFADRLNSHASTISQAMNGNPSYLTDRLIKVRIPAAFPGIFSDDWLKKAEGDMLVSSTTVSGDLIQQKDSIANSGSIDSHETNNFFPESNFDQQLEKQREKKSKSDRERDGIRISNNSVENDATIIRLLDIVIESNKSMMAMLFETNKKIEDMNRISEKLLDSSIEKDQQMKDLISEIIHGGNREKQ